MCLASRGLCVNATRAKSSQRGLPRFCALSLVLAGRKGLDCFTKQSTGTVGKVAGRFSPPGTHFAAASRPNSRYKRISAQVQISFFLGAGRPTRGGARSSWVFFSLSIKRLSVAPLALSPHEPLWSKFVRPLTH